MTVTITIVTQHTFGYWGLFSGSGFGQMTLWDGTQYLIFSRNYNLIEGSA